eukprot:198773_1
MENIDIFKKFANGKNDYSLSKMNFFCMMSSTALMTYFYRLSCSREELKERVGPKQENVTKYAKYLRYAAWVTGSAVIYHFMLYPDHRLTKIENNLNIPNEFNLSKKQRYGIAAFIAIPAIIIELLGWKEAKWTVFAPHTQKELFGGIYNYIRHPIYLCEFSWFYTLSILMNDPFLFIISG